MANVWVHYEEILDENNQQLITFSTECKELKTFGCNVEDIYECIAELSLEVRVLTRPSNQLTILYLKS